MVSKRAATAKTSVDVMQKATVKWTLVPPEIQNDVIQECADLARAEDKNARRFFYWERDGDSHGLYVIYIPTMVQYDADEMFQRLLGDGSLDFPKPDDASSIDMRIWVETVKAIKAKIKTHTHGVRVYDWNENRDQHDPNNWFHRESNGFTVNKLAAAA